MTGAAMLITGTAAAAAANAAEPTTVGDADSLTKTVEESHGDIAVMLDGDIELSKTLAVPAGSNVTLTGNHSLTFAADAAYADAGSGKAAVTVADSAALTLSGGVTLDGTGCSDPNVSALYSNGAVTLDGGGITNFTQHSSGNRSLIMAEGDHATFAIKAGSITGNVSKSNPGGVLEVSKGAKLTMSGGQITGNTASTSADMAAIVIVGISQGASLQAGGATNADPAGSFEFTGGAISGNTATSTVYVGEANAALGPELHIHEVTFSHTNEQGETVGTRASMTMRGDATISDNTASRFGGGVVVWGPGEFIMEGGTISANKSPMGAGVAAVDTFSMGTLERRKLRSDKEYGGVSLEEWSLTRPAAFTMNGGTISSNIGTVGTGGDGTQFEPVGAGVYVSSNMVQLNAGRIIDNTAVSELGGQGGGIYVSSLPYTVGLRKAVVAHNTATMLGGGMWLCPMGGAQYHVKNSGAIMANTSQGAGDDIASLAKGREGGDTGASLSLADRLLGNHRVDWYQDGAISKEPGVLGVADQATARYERQSDAERVKIGGVIEENKDDIALKAVTDDDDTVLEAALSQAQLFIEGNTAVRGGGIGANGVVRFGDAPLVYPGLDVKVAKQWQGEGDHPQSVGVTLYLLDDDGGRHAVNEATLSEENDWTVTFSETFDGDPLPKYGAYGESHVAVATGRALSRYVVEEAAVDGYEVSVDDWTHSLEVAHKAGATIGGAGELAAQVQSAPDLGQFTRDDDAGRVWSERFEDVDGQRAVVGGVDEWSHMFTGLPDASVDGNGQEVRRDYRVVLAGKSNEDFAGLSDEQGGFDKLAAAGVTVRETIETVITNTREESRTPDDPASEEATLTVRKVAKGCRKDDSFGITTVYNEQSDSASYANGDAKDYTVLFGKRGGARSFTVSETDPGDGVAVTISDGTTTTAGTSFTGTIRPGEHITVTVTNTSADCETAAVAAPSAEQPTKPSTQRPAAPASILSATGATFAGIAVCAVLMVALGAIVVFSLRRSHDFREF